MSLLSVSTSTWSIEEVIEVIAEHFESRKPFGVLMRCKPRDPCCPLNGELDRGSDGC